MISTSGGGVAAAAPQARFGVHRRDVQTVRLLVQGQFEAADVAPVSHLLAADARP
jgi:hypothetical protein